MEGQWVGLERADATLGQVWPLLQVRLSNREHERRRAVMTIAVSVDGTVRHTRYALLTVPAMDTASKWLRLPLQASVLRGQRYSGRIQLTLALRPGKASDADGQHAGNNFALPTVWFHHDGEKFLFYRDRVMRERYAGGNFRSRPLNVPDSSEALRRAVAEAGLPRTRLILDRVAQRWTASPSTTPRDPESTSAKTLVRPATSSPCRGDGSPSVRAVRRCSRGSSTRTAAATT